MRNKTCVIIIKVKICDNYRNYYNEILGQTAFGMDTFKLHGESRIKIIATTNVVIIINKFKL